MKILSNPLFMLAVVVIAFLIAILSVSPSSLQEMGPGDFYVFEVIPIPYWIAIAVMVATMFFMIPQLKNKKFNMLLIVSSILLIISFRSAFPIQFTSIPAYEPDASNYLSVTNSWVNQKLDLGVEGDYQHNFPMSFLVAYLFGKLGMSIDTFYRVAPFAIYVLEILLLYLITKQILDEDKKNGPIPIIVTFLFSFSSLGYWVTVHWCPDLIGSLMYFVAFYLAITFAKKGSWHPKEVLPLFVSIFILILSHHLSTLYLIVTFVGFAIAIWLFKPKQFKNGALTFLLLGIFTYTLWFIYGALVYPSFFNIYMYYGGGYNSITTLSQNAGLLPNLSFAVYPAFILVLFAIEVFLIFHLPPKVLLVKITRKVFSGLRHPRTIVGKTQRLCMIYNWNNLLVYASGFSLIFILFIVGIPVPALFGTRILEVLFIGFYPLAGQALINLTERKSWKIRALIFVILILVVIIADYRYYAQIQRRVIIG